MSSCLQQTKATVLECLSCLCADMDSVVEELENGRLPFDVVSSKVSELVDMADDLQQKVCDLVDILEASLPDEDSPVGGDQSQAEEDQAEC